MDIITLLGAKVPQQGPQGPRGTQRAPSLVASEPVQVDCSDDEGEESEVESEDKCMEDEEESLIEEESDDEIHLPDYYFANFEFGRCTLEEYE